MHKLKMSGSHNTRNTLESHLGGRQLSWKSSRFLRPLQWIVRHSRRLLCFREPSPCLRYYQQSRLALLSCPGEHRSLRLQWAQLQVGLKVAFFQYSPLQSRGTVIVKNCGPLERVREWMSRSSSTKRSLLLSWPRFFSIHRRV